MVKYLQYGRRAAEVLWRVPTRLFGSRNERLLKQYSHDVAAINALESEVAKLSDDELRGRTEAFRAELAEGKTLDELLVPAFATRVDSLTDTPKLRSRL